MHVVLFVLTKQMLVAACPSMYSLSSREVPALEHLAGIQPKPVLTKGFRASRRVQSSEVDAEKLGDPKFRMLRPPAISQRSVSPPPEKGGGKIGRWCRVRGLNFWH